MWYLQTDTLGLLLAFTVLFALGACLLRKLRPAARLTPFLVLAGLALLYVTAPALAAFYVIYTALSWLLTLLLRKTPKGGFFRRALFVTFCVLDVLPLFWARLGSGLGLPVLAVALAGFSYNMLKAVDALYYAYYTGRDVGFLPYANFLLFFPVFTGGPILRYRDFIKYYEKPLPLTAALTETSVRRMIRGLFKKLVLVTWLGYATERLLALESHFYVSLALALVSYALLYCDMSGYADMAVAAGALCGVGVAENFKKPWTAASFTQLWRKWHVTLGDWIREHIFVVVAGKKLNKYISALIALCTMIVMALWYGFTPVYLLQGAAMGVLLALENLLGLSTVDKRKTKKWVYALRCAFVTVIFSADILCFTLTRDELLRALAGFFR